MKTGHWMMKAMVPAVGLVVLLSLDSSARAVYDKGDLGKYERHGKHMILVKSPARRITASPSPPENRMPGTVSNKDKHDSFQRHGRYAPRELQAKPRVPRGHEGMTQGKGMRVVRHIKHIHRLPN